MTSTYEKEGKEEDHIHDDPNHLSACHGFAEKRGGVYFMGGGEGRLRGWMRGGGK